MKKIYEMSVKIFKKENGSPTSSSIFTLDDEKIRNQDIGMVLLELEQHKQYLVSLMKPDIEVMKNEIDDIIDYDEDEKDYTK